MVTLKKGAWKVQWIERERGYGEREDGVWYFPTEEIATQRTKEQLAEMRANEAKLYNGTPDEYSYPLEAEFVEVSETLATEIEEKGEVWRRWAEGEEIT